MAMQMQKKLSYIYRLSLMFILLSEQWIASLYKLAVNMNSSYCKKNKSLDISLTDKLYL